MGADSDADLVALARAGDREAWSRLCHRHAPRLAAYLGARLRRPTVVEKLVEEAIVLAFKNLDKIDADESFAAWFRRVGAHLALRWYKDNRDEPLTEPFPVERCGGEAQRVKRLLQLEAALATLSDAQRMAIEQCHRADLHGEGLAEVLHLEPARAERLLEDAMAALERAWERETT